MKKSYKFDAMSALQDACIEAVDHKLELATYYEEHYRDDNGNVMDWAAKDAQKMREIAAAMQNIISEMFGA